MSLWPPLQGKVKHNPKHKHNEWSQKAEDIYKMAPGTLQPTVDPLDRAYSLSETIILQMLS